MSTAVEQMSASVVETTSFAETTQTARGSAPHNSLRWLWDVHCAASLCLAVPFVGRFLVSVIFIGLITIGALMLLQLPLLVAFVYVRNVRSQREQEERRVQQMLCSPQRTD